MNKKTISIITACAVALSLAGCGKEETKAPESAATNVTVCKADYEDIETTVEYTGEIKAGDVSSVSVLVSARAEKINAEVGDYVNAGDVLMTLDTTQYQLAYNQALAAYNLAQASKDTTVAAKDSAEASYNNITGGSLEQSKLNANQAVSSAQSAYNTALDNYNRQKALFDIGAVSRVALDTAKTNLDNAESALSTAKANARINEDVVIPHTTASAQAGVNQAQAGVNQAQASIRQAKVALDSAQSNLANCVVKAPISGYITAKNITSGQLASPGYEIFQIKNSEIVDVEINVTESVIASIAPGTKATIDIDSAGLKGIEGVVSSVAAAKNDVTGMFPVKIAVSNKDGKIKVGMIAEISLVTQRLENILAIDFNAVLKDGEINYVYVEQGGKAVRKDIVTGISNGKKVEILSGLEKGERVIVDGKEFLSKENNKVKVVK